MNHHSSVQTNRNPIIECSKSKVFYVAIVFLVGLITFACSEGDDKAANTGGSNAATGTGNESGGSSIVNEYPGTTGGSERTPSTLDAGRTDGATTRPGKGGAGGTTPTSGSGSSGVGGSGAAGAPESGGAEVEPDAGVDAGPVADCTPSDWVDPGTVPNPEVVAVAPDAGTKGHVFGGAWGMEEFDYVEEEFFFSNSTPEIYTTRLVVRRPRDPARFSGIVYQEWLNVSGLMDVAVMWGTSREYFMRNGHVHMSVSAQLMGIGTLQGYDAERYAPLVHPGDQAADAIFSQAAEAVRAQSELLLGPCMPVDRVYAMGQSQSAMRLASYVDASHPIYNIFDGFLIHSGPQPSLPPSSPVFMIHTMTEGNCTLPDGPNMICWAVAGSTHNDDRILSREIDEVGSCFGLTEPPFKCQNPLNEFPSWRVYNAALDWLNLWVANGETPPAGDRFEGDPPLSRVDEHGNALGGVRLPDIDVPIATHNQDNGPGPENPLDILSMLACGLSGNSVYFDQAKLLQLYPTHEDYVNQYRAAADAAMAAGYLLQADYDEAMAEAEAAPIPK